MNPPERPDQPSIFNRPDQELEDDPPISRPADQAPDPAIVEQPTPPDGDPLFPRGIPRRERAGLSRTTMLALGGGALLIAVIGAGAGVLLFSPKTPAAVGTSPSPSEPAPSVSAEESAEASPSESAAPSATPQPPAEPLAAGQWATIVADVAEVRGDAALSAPVRGQANQGEIVFIAESAPVKADGLTWYRAVVSPGLSGWIAGHDAVSSFAVSDAPTASAAWCAVPEETAFDRDQYGQPTEKDAVRVGRLPLDSEVLGVSGAAVIELAWGTQDQVCLDLEIRAGRTSAVALDTTFEGCGHPYHGGPVTVVFGTGAVGPDGVADSRMAVLHGAIVGYDTNTAGERPNLADVLLLGAYGELGSESGEVCFTGSASGDATSPTIRLNGAVTKCVQVDEVSSSAVTMSHPENHWTVELRLTEGSFVGTGVTRTHIERFYRISADRGLDGSVGISPRDDNCLHSS